MYIGFDFILKSFIAVSFIYWFGFSLLIAFRSQAWFDYQNRLSHQYRYQWSVIDETRFLNTHRRIGILLIVFGAVFVAMLVRGFIVI